MWKPLGNEVESERDGIPNGRGFGYPSTGYLILFPMDELFLTVTSQYRPKVVIPSPFWEGFCE